MKLIFLDLDGVLVTRRPGTFEDRLLRNLQGLVQRTNAEVVLSSDWRRHPSARDEARRMLGTVGIRIIGSTPCMSPFVPQRPTEILQWKKEFAKRMGDKDPVTHWVAIDDRPLIDERHGNFLRGHFVQTHPLRGLTEQAVEECYRLLTAEGVAPPVTDFDMELDSPNPRGINAPAGAKFRGNSVGARGRGGWTAPSPGPSASMAGAAAAAAALNSTATPVKGPLPPLSGGAAPPGTPERSPGPSAAAAYPPASRGRAIRSGQQHPPQTPEAGPAVARGGSGGSLSAAGPGQRRAHSAGPVVRVGR